MIAILAIQPDENGDTRLHYAAASNKIEALIKMLHGKDIDVDVRNKDGLTALHVAAREGHYDAVQYLVDGGADVFAVTSSGLSAVDLAGVHVRLRNQLTRIETAKLSALENNEVKKAAQTTALHVMAKLGRVNIVNRLLNRTTLLQREEDGNTPLHVAALYNRLDVVEKMLQVEGCSEILMTPNVVQ
ncbi:hypothetical protein ACHHYP_20097 [Achlya hypogyna]|uniref:Uncharacterized protein n=1 Tax=Achlya hypogyna TaxID=1202772 RepID=A0A1V9ZS98_ACHHY|nr:hypothetical protein ACHHYP_20097 [Achlya hypogyna]